MAIRNFVEMWLLEIFENFSNSRTATFLVCIWTDFAKFNLFRIQAPTTRVLMIILLHKAFIWKCHFFVQMPLCKVAYTSESTTLKISRHVYQNTDLKKACFAGFLDKMKNGDIVIPALFILLNLSKCSLKILRIQ